MDLPCYVGEKRFVPSRYWVQPQPRDKAALWNQLLKVQEKALCLTRNGRFLSLSVFRDLCNKFCLSLKQPEQELCSRERRGRW